MAHIFLKKGTTSNYLPFTMHALISLEKFNCFAYNL